MAQTVLDAAQVDELVTMYVGGGTMREVAEHFRVHRTTVAIHLRHRPVPVHRGKLTGEQVAEIGRLYEQGFTLAEIGVRCDVGQDTVRRAVLDAGGVIRRPCDGPQGEHRFEVAEARLFQQCAEHGAVACLRSANEIMVLAPERSGQHLVGHRSLYQRTASWPELSSRG
jgi:hypothetical protein